MAASANPVMVPSVREDARFFEAIDETTGYRTASLVAVPVFGRDDRSPGGQAGAAQRRVVGVIEALNKRSAAAFDEGDLALLEALAEQVGEALALTHLDDSDGRPVRFSGIIGGSAAMRSVYQVMASAAATDATVLVTGESGTGKELVARAVHANSGRADGPFVKVDCASIPGTLIEAELFGHEKGAFTGADRLVKGKCELASGGTLFLDEIGDMPLSLQARLLRFVQDRELERIGGRQVIRADVRVVAATHRDLEGAVRRGTFRQDLYYRIKVVSIELPALRERGADDVTQLARHFVRLYARRHRRPVRSIEAQALAALRSYDWPGNIRELEHSIESAVVLCQGQALELEHLRLPRAVASTPAAAGATAEPAAGATAEPATGAPRAPARRRRRSCPWPRSRSATSSRPWPPWAATAPARPRSSASAATPWPASSGATARADRPPRCGGRPLAAESLAGRGSPDRGAAPLLGHDARDRAGHIGGVALRLILVGRNRCRGGARRACLARARSRRGVAGCGRCRAVAGGRSDARGGAVRGPAHTARRKLAAVHEPGHLQALPLAGVPASSRTAGEMRIPGERCGARPQRRQ